MDGLGYRGVLTSSHPVSGGHHLRGQEDKRFEGADGPECYKEGHLRRRAHSRPRVDHRCLHFVRFCSGELNK